MAFAIARPRGVVVDAVSVEGECRESEEEWEVGCVGKGYVERRLGEGGFFLCDIQLQRWIEAGTRDLLEGFNSVASIIAFRSRLGRKTCIRISFSKLALPPIALYSLSWCTKTMPDFASIFCTLVCSDMLDPTRSP